MENKLPLFKFIKRDAIIKIEIGAGMIEKFLEILQYFSKNLTENQIEQYHKELNFYKDIANKEKEFSEAWMYPVTTLSFFLQEIEKQADLQGQTFEDNIEDYLKNSITSITGEDSQSAPQSQSQPE